MESEDQDKPNEPTQKRLEDARKKGQIARSQDALTASVYAGFLIAALGFGESALLASADAGMTALHSPARIDAWALSIAMLSPVLPLFLLPAVSVLGLLLLQRGLVFTGENLLPQLSRIDPLAASKHRFGPDGLMEFLKGTTKMTLVSLLLALILQRQLDALIATPMLDPGPGSAFILAVLVQFLAAVLAISLVFAAGDMMWQIHRHRKRNRMSRQELMDEHREAEGDPQTRAIRRQRAQEIALNRMLADVPTADVVVVNPEHYAVALKWHRSRRQAPICIAKGVDDAALRIRQIAAEHSVPIHRDPPTARALHASVEVGAEIRPEHYRSVAAAIRFAEAMRKRARAVR